MPKPNFFGETAALDSATRANAPGQFVRLSLGSTHYELAGPSTGRLVVLVHGFSVPYAVWDPTFAALTGAGLRVLRYDLYGRGYSDRLELENGPELFDRQLADLIAALGDGQPVDLVGLSMGGPIVATFADRHPERVRRLVLIAPAGYSLGRGPILQVVRLPLAGELLWRLASPWVMRRELGAILRGGETPGYVAPWHAALRIHGSNRALLSTVRHFPIERMAPVYERIGQHPRPILLIWGRADHLVPYANSDRLRRALPRAEFHAIDGAGHTPHYERPEVVNPLLIRFLVGEDSETCTA